jgi:thiamine-phosphate pyrophosphorylase
MIRIPTFYPILDTATALRHGVPPVDAARAILDAGASILQFRHKTFYSREAHAWLEQISELSRAAGATLVVNDRADLAVLFDAVLHLGQEDLPPSAARRITDSQTDSMTDSQPIYIGFSTHNEAQLRAAASEPIDYLAIGPMFDTVSKQNPDPVVGLDELRRLRPLAAKPLVAIGGITRTNARQVLEAGADSVAVIGDLFPDDGDIAARIGDWLRLLG